MAYDEGLAERIRGQLSDRDDVVEKKMFGGVAFMLSGNMACGVVKERLMVRVGKAGYEACMALPYAQPMDFTGKPIKTMVFVAPDGTASDKDLAAWVSRGLEFARSLPAK